MRTKFKQWAVDYLKEHHEIVVDKIDFSLPYFQKNLSMEVGSGKGDFMLSFSQLHPEMNFIAVERVETVAGMMAKKLKDAEVNNVLIFPFDVKIIFEQMPEKSLDAIYLNFVDPWPKKKHAKRRLTFITFLESYYRLLKDGGHLYFKSDNQGLFLFSVEELKKTKFTLELIDDNYDFDEYNDVQTEYEKKFRNIGMPIYRIVAKK